MWTVAQLRADLDAGRTSSRDLVAQALGRIEDRNGEGGRAFLKVYADAARADAAHADRLRQAGVRRSAVDGLPVSLKDLFDVAGEVTRAGSRIRENFPSAKIDAPAVARLRAAGAVFIGRTNMVEFAFGGVGFNPHYGTPKNPYERKIGRVPGGSSSGAAVAQADGMAVMSLGSDTRGSIRGPAALCGVTGWKPTARRVPREGAFPLSFTLDSIGPLANSVACCAAYDAILAGEPEGPLPRLEAKGLRLLLPRSSALDELDRDVAAAFDSSLRILSRVGAILEERPVPQFDRQGEYFKGGGYAGAEAYHIHRANQERIDEYDPRVGKRVLLGKNLTASDYLAFADLRVEFIRQVDALAAGFDAILMPTVPCIAPTIAEADATDEDYFRWNMRILRNNGLINFLDGCAASLPCHEPGGAPVGLMVCGVGGSDRHTLAVSAAIERALARD
ncbi:MAG TPA: amidase [Burkholderiales bacterium]|jgi:aspartyl-tRNA(Asn)/glutamyl-tRNA(Gln) amidotransferase subunit A|nr:amidase [Burkholderiales bacterium]